MHERKQASRQSSSQPLVFNAKNRIRRRNYPTRSKLIPEA